jgi:hypothetical protein
LHGANDQKVLAGGDRESVGAGFTDSGIHILDVVWILVILVIVILLRRRQTGSSSTRIVMLFILISAILLTLRD